MTAQTCHGPQMRATQVKQTLCRRTCGEQDGRLALTLAGHDEV